MRNCLLWAFCLITGWLGAQTVDSVALRRVDSLIQVSRALTAKRDFDQALDVNAVAEKIALKKLGQQSAAYGSCCFNRGRTLFLKRDYTSAEKWYNEAKAIREKALGREHPDYATSLNNLAILYKNMGQYEKAEPLYLEAKAIREKALGREHPDYAASLNNLGILYENTGQYEKAEPFYLESKAIREKALGREHPDYAASLNNLAILYENSGQYEKAEPLYVESKAIREKALGTEHPDYAASLSNLAGLYRDMGQYEKAEPLYLESKDIREKALGKEHPDYAASLNNLGILYWTMGQYEKAEPLYLESKAIREKALGREHPYYAASLNNLAGLYQLMGQFEKAEPLYLESKAIRKKALGTEHPDYAASLSNLAILYENMGQYEKAEPLNLEAKAIREKALGKEHLDYAASLQNLAVLYRDMGQYEKAEPLNLEAKAIREKALGRENPGYAESLQNLAGLYQDMGQYEKAELHLLEWSTVNMHIIEQALHHLSESELNNYLDKFSNSQNQTLSFTQIARSKKMNPICYDNSLFYKGFLLQSTGRIKQLALSDEGTAEKYIRLIGYQRRLATQYAQPIAKRDSPLIAQLEAKANDIEKDLARTVAGFGQALRQVKWQEIQTALKPSEAAIEFVSYRFYQKKKTDSMLYAALVLLPGTDAPKFIPLFEEKHLSVLLKTEGNPQPAFYNDLYANDKKGDQLYHLIWEPISAALPQGTTVYCSPSSLLHRINLGAIPTPDGKTLAEKHRLSTLGSTRQLVVPPVPTTQQSATAQLYGGIQYDATPTVAANTPAKPEDLAARRGPDITQNDSTLRGENWNYLRWTEVEISAAANVMKSKGIMPTLNKGAEATEESFKALGQGNPSPRVLHLATHGFFFPDPKESKPNKGQAIGEKTFKVSDNPMIRSGLVLAGGNHAWKTGKPLSPGLEDGILTAYEISQMNLANTELVVLSACETGLGDLVGNEGVYGLQRAFKIAGAKYLIMSLWQVPDFQTQVFMTAFYKHWLEGKMAVPEAFRATQAELRGRYSGEAFKWAGFVLVE
ncbi:CHAT domain-containing protein [Haliscomenobacter sp.]|uniref:CHAT domain-containing protein n=1 Tax=Haliscomenobacter sp. TaxID=2717303 RepID=UPI003BA91EE7